MLRGEGIVCGRLKDEKPRVRVGLGLEFPPTGNDSIRDVYDFEGLDDLDDVREEIWKDVDVNLVKPVESLGPSPTGKGSLLPFFKCDIATSKHYTFISSHLIKNFEFCCFVMQCWILETLFIHA